MTELAELVDAALQPPPSIAIAPTGFRVLDDVSGGLQAGRVWIITGVPGQGRTTLLTQWAGALAVEQGWATRLVVPREDARTCGARLIASQVRVPMQHALRGQLSVKELGRIASAGRLREAPLKVRFSSGHGGIRDPWWTAEATADQAQAIFIDDVELLPEALDFIPQWSQQGSLVVVSLPRHLLLQDPEIDADLDPTWTAVADVIVEVRHLGLRSTDPNRIRIGEADLTMLRHRHGPLISCPVAFQGYFSRFVDLAIEWP